MITVLSCFDGISCGRVALERAGITVDKYYASEIDKYAVKVAQKNYPETIQLGDVTHWRDWDIEKPDLITFGNPCQSYSVAGLRKGLDDPRGQLIFHVFDILNKYKPENFLMENVKGLLSANRGKAFEMMLKTYNKIGYAVDYMIINSALVSAQNRERVYVIGKRLDLCQGKTYAVSFEEDIKNVKSKSKRNTRNG